MLKETTLNLDTSTGVIIIGGQENALAVTRSLGRRGIDIAVIGSSGTLALKSRYCRQPIVALPGEDIESACRRLLVEEPVTGLRGRIIFPCSDEAIKFVAENEPALRNRYILEEASPAQRLAMLDKLKTLELANEAGVPAPKFWRTGAGESLESIAGEISFPAMIKPVHSHEFTKVFGCKLFIIESDLEELQEKLAEVRRHDLEVMVVEMIPGPDTLLSSYYTYITRDGWTLYEFTKKIIRRFPENRGAACCHETEWLPETREAGARFFEKIGFRGMGNIEFKRDVRDGQLKIIEVNARFTAAQVQANRAGADLDIIAYAHLTDQPVPKFVKYREGLRYWYPMRDYQAFRALHRQGRLSMMSWFMDVLRGPSVNPYFAWDDMAPVRHAVGAFFKKRIKG